MSKLTADTITDEQIKALRDHSEWWTVVGDIDIIDCCNRALGHKDGPNRFQQFWTVEECREQIAEILNARNEVKP